MDKDMFNNYPDEVVKKWKTQRDEIEGHMTFVCAVAQNTISTVQKVTEHLKMTPDEHVKLGDALIALHDACEKFRNYRDAN